MRQGKLEHKACREGGGEGMKSGSGGVEVVIAAGEQPPAPAEETNLLRVPSDLLRWFGLPPQRKGSDLREQIAREIAKEISYSWIETEELETADEAAAVAVVEKGVETVEAVEAEEAAATARQKIVRGQSSRRQSEPKHAAAEDAQVPLRDSPRGEGGARSSAGRGPCGLPPHAVRGARARARDRARRRRAQHLTVGAAAGAGGGATRRVPVCAADTEASARACSRAARTARPGAAVNPSPRR